ncbi:MAG: hypothetical protein FJ292_07640 [Planctomycetes bacterium]|nr:hypothetical protein [Planctomycetota bacterium]
MTDQACTCPACASTTMIGSENVGFCTSCGTLSLAGNAVPLVAIMLVALALRARSVLSGRVRSPVLSTRASIVVT